MKDVLEQLVKGTYDEAQAAQALLALNDAITPENLALCVQTLKAHQMSFELSMPRIVFDVCGTGGDKARSGTSTFNISTAVAFVVAACGVPVIKHANRAASGLSGSVDVLDYLGVPSNLNTQQAQKCFEGTNLLFLSAAHYYPSLKKLAPIRKALGVPTIFNLAGPLANPAPITHQITGCYAADKAHIMAQALTLLGRENFAVLHAQDGLDEISPNAQTTVFTSTFEDYISPNDFGFMPNALEDIKGGDASINAKIIEDIFLGAKGPPRDVVIINAAFALSRAGLGFLGGVEKAQAALDSGAVTRLLKAMRGYV